MVEYTVDMYRRSDLGQEFMDVVIDYNVELAKLVINLGVDALAGGDLAYKDGP